MHLSFHCSPNPYFDALATFQADRIATQRAPLVGPTPDAIELMLTQYLSLAPHFDSTIRDHAGVANEPQRPADLMPLLAKILRSFHEHSAALPPEEQPPQRKAGFQ